MKCQHCRLEFHPEEKVYELGKDTDYVWTLLRYDCPACRRMNLVLAYSSPYPLPPNSKRQKEGAIIVWPKASGRPPCPPEVPSDLATDYTEACIVSQDSPKASAALSRRCLQNMLRNAANVKPGDLANEIQQVIDSGKLPSYLTETIDAVRQIGNFAAGGLSSLV
jgi:hypothetical protein